MTHVPASRFTRTAIRSAGATGATLALLLTALVPTARAASLPAPDGKSEATAAASCWEVKVNTPSAPSGVYWLYTPALRTPQQFYCDQTTNGGGWVLVGHGRDTFSASSDGYGSTADVAAGVDGSGGFAARELSSATIGALLNGSAVSSLPDGVRLRRATNTTGTAWQEVQFTFSSPRDDWSWQFNDVQRVKTWTVGSSSGTGGTTKSFGTGTGLNLVQTQTSKTLGYSTGFGYGSSVTGSSSSTSYLYQGTAGYVRPYTQVYLRPKLMSSSILAAFPDSGTAAVTQPSIAKSLALGTIWGVNGLGAAGGGIQNTEVSAFTESKSRVFVGGNFAHVQKDKNGTGLVGQAYLASFDVATGQLITTFKPTFNNQVKALATLPDGRIVAGGDFSKVNGVAENGLVVLDPISGSIDSAFTGRLINALGTSGGQAIVRTLDVQGTWLYVGGSFTHATGGSTTAQIYSRGAVRLAVTDGTPDKTWTAEFDGTVISLDASSRGDRVYFAGYFANDKGTPALRGAALTTTTGSVIPWTIDFTSSTASYQQAVREVGDRVWIGGSEHMIFSYNRSDMSEASTNVMSAEGGDGQVLADDGTNVYGGCHCYYANYSGAHTHDFRNPGTAWTRVSAIDAVGAWNASTGAYATAFSPSFTEREGAGGWAVFTDSTGVTWMGGDFTAVRTSATAKAWAGGYARFPRNDSTAPTVPSGLKVTTDASGDTASWTGSTDAGGKVTYQVMRNDRVVATTTSTSVTLPAAPSGTKYFVRAADPSGNVSASTAAVTAATAAPAATVFVENGSTWSYYHQVTAPASDWLTPSFDSSAWPTGKGALGWGTGPIVTQIPAPSSPRPLATYFRASFTVPAGGIPAAGLTLTTRADDGVIVFVNGTEVGRANLPSGPITSSTYALSAPSTTTAVANPVQFTVPASLLQEGTNVIAAEVQSNYKSTPSVSFDLRAVAN